jgi:hypothetical protein
MKRDRSRELELLSQIIGGDESAFSELKTLYWSVTWDAIASHCARDKADTFCEDAWKLIQFGLKRSTNSERVIELASEGRFLRFVEEAAMESLAIHQLKGELGENLVATGFSSLKKMHRPSIEEYLRPKGANVKYVATSLWSKVWEKRNQYSFRKASFSSWLRGIARHEFVNWIRSNNPRIDIKIPISLTKKRREELERKIGLDLSYGRTVHVTLELNKPTRSKAEEAVEDLLGRLGGGISIRSRSQFRGNKVIVDLVWDGIPKPPPVTPAISSSEFDELEQTYFIFNQALKQLCRNEINVFAPRRLVYGFVHLLLYTVSQVEEELINIPLSDVAQSFEQECLEKMAAREIPNCFDDYSAHFASLHKEMKLLVRDAVSKHDFGSAKRLKTLLSSPVGDTTLGKHCGTDPSKTFSNWNDDTESKLCICVVKALGQ